MINEQSSKDEVLQSVRINGTDLQHASKELRMDEEVVHAATIQNCCAFRHADESLKSNKDFALALLNSGHNIYSNLHLDLRDQYDIALAAVSKHGGALHFVKKELFNKALFLAAVKNDGMVLYLSNKCREGYQSEDVYNTDKEIVLAAVKENGLAISSACLALQGDREVISAAVNQNGHALYRLDLSIIRDKEKFILAAVKQCRHESCCSDSAFHPFLKSYIQLEDKINKLNDGTTKSNANAILNKVEELFLNHGFYKSGISVNNTSDLAEVLNKTHALICNPKTKEITDYQVFIQKALKSPYSGMQLLGKLMMALAVALVGAAIAMGVTGVGVLPAVAVGVLAVGLFSVGTRTVQQSTKHQNNLIEALKSNVIAP